MIKNVNMRTRQLEAIELFPNFEPKFKIFYNTIIELNEPQITFNFSKNDWIVFLEYTNLLARGGFANKNDTLIYLNDLDISDQDYISFNPNLYENLIKKDNKITIIVLKNWTYFSCIWIYPTSWSNENINIYLDLELKNWL